MLELKNITKTYYSKSGNVEALHGVSMSFPDNQFVSILGPSGCGKTTLLNIIGGLDKYTTGDYIVNGVSSKDFKENDWNTFRNHSVGFVFQSYNLIPHQNVLSNVEIALTLSGIDSKERKQRAIEALEKVGLKDQIYKKPNQLSGGQAQRVAIARAIVNNPDIILADEPTGALDSETSIQVMNILKELSKTTLVVMVTHNPDLAYQYSDRIIKLFDGNVIDDSLNKEETVIIEKEVVDKGKKKHTSMNIFTAFFLSLMNLLSKKSRTILTSIAGSIGIIGVSLVLALSTGFKAYIDKVQKDSLSSYPLVVSQASIDLSSIVNYTPANLDKYPNIQKIFVNKINDILKDTIRPNSITEEYINDVINKIPSEYLQAISYEYPVCLNIYKENNHDNGDGSYTLRADRVSEISISGMGYIFNQLIDDEEFVRSQYDVLAGKYPTNYNELVIVVDQYNQITDYVLDMLYLDKDIYVDSTDGNTTIDFDKIIGTTFKFCSNDALYPVSGGVVKNNTTKTEDGYCITKEVYDHTSNEELKIVGVLRLNENTTTGLMGEVSPIGYLPSLIDYIYEQDMSSELITYYKNNKESIIASVGETNYESILTYYGGVKIPSRINIYPIDFNSKEKIKEYLDSKNNEMYEEKMNEYYLEKGKEYCNDTLTPVIGETEEEINEFYISMGKKYHGTDKEFTTAMAEAKAVKVNYTDIMALIISSVSTIIDAITYVLIAFTSISLIVSSIMIGVITYISVIERTKEIGILRALGARRKDVFRIFNAETFLIGLTSGIFGCSVTALLCIPINAILNSLAGIGNVASLGFGYAIIIIIISFTLTVVAGLIPSGKATKIDPVIALRTE